MAYAKRLKNCDLRLLVPVCGELLIFEQNQQFRHTQVIFGGDCSKRLQGREGRGGAQGGGGVVQHRGRAVIRHDQVEFAVTVDVASVIERGLQANWPTRQGGLPARQRPEDGDAGPGISGTARDSGDSTSTGPTPACCKT